MTTFRQEALAQIIRSRLATDTRTNGQTIEIEIYDEQVVLIGMCDNEDQRLAANSIVLGTAGVHVVIDNLHIRRHIAAAA